MVRPGEVDDSAEELELLVGFEMVQIEEVELLESPGQVRGQLDAEGIADEQAALVGERILGAVAPQGLALLAQLEDPVGLVALGAEPGVGVGAGADGAAEPEEHAQVVADLVHLGRFVEQQPVDHAACPEQVAGKEKG